MPDPEDAEDLIRDLYGRAEGLLYTIADAAVSASPDSAVTTTTKQSNNDWLSGIANYMETVLKVRKYTSIVLKSYFFPGKITNCSKSVFVVFIM